MPRVKKSPAYQWYPRDYMSDALVVSMTLEQEGAYRRLMDVCWLERGLPKDVDELWRLAKAPSRDRFVRVIWPLVGRKFQPRKGKYQHKRLDKERAKQAKTRKARKLAADGRWEQERSKRNANAPVQQSLTSALTSSSSATAGTEEKSTGAPRRPVQKAVENAVGTFGLYCVIAEEALETSVREDQDDSLGNVAEWFKTLCARRHLDYDGEMTNKAIAAVMANRERKAAS